MLSYDVLCRCYDRLSRWVPYSDLCRWEDWLRSHTDVPDDLLQLVVLARGWQHQYNRFER